MSLRQVSFFFAGGISILYCLLLFSCDEPKNNTAEYRALMQTKAKKISADFTGLLTELNNISTFTENLYSNNKSVGSSLSSSLFHSTSEGILYKDQEDGTSAIFAGGYDKKQEEISKIINNTNPLDSIFKKIIEKYYPFAAQIYYAERHPIVRMYPYSDLTSQLSSEIEISSFMYYYNADLIHNPDRDAVFINRPYADPAGRGWVVSFIAPVYHNLKMQGVIGIDVTLRALAEKYFTPDTADIFLVDSSGVTIYANDNTASLLSLPKIKEYKYLQFVNEDTYLSEKFNILKSRNKNVRDAFTEILVNKKTSSSCEINSVNHLIIAENIPGFPWYLVKIVIPEE